MPREELILLLLLFLVTLGDHAGVPNLYVLTMILAEGKGLHPTLIFLVAFSSIFLYELVLYLLGRWARTHPLGNSRPFRYLFLSTKAVSRLLTERVALWLIFGRFVAFVGLYIPFAAGQMGTRAWVFLLCSVFGTALQLTAYGIPAYLLGKPFEGIIQRVPLVWISLLVLLAVALIQAIVWYPPRSPQTASADPSRALRRGGMRRSRGG
ncbi:MAG: hypothetical protein KatS3mg115_1943 [Candidatus Poribacteria bacterium]|nr:MAG: hypothetical protein KatS3mg115_1943 [Candidatus Poribacteria bacterium]